MAASMTSSSSSSESDENSEKLDPLSPIFDPRRALYAKTMKLPVQNPRQFNNVAEFENFLKGKDSESLKKLKTEKKKLPGIVAERAAAQAREAVRKSAILAKSGGAHERSQTQLRKLRTTTVFTRIEGYKGPLSVLRKCMEEKLKVVVVVRAAVSVRSRCKGYVIAFDKHFNMALMDVDETYIRSCEMKKEKNISEKRDQKKDLSSKSMTNSERLAKPQPAGQTLAANKTESIVQEKLSEIFHGVSVEGEGLSESYHKKCSISGAKTKQTSADASANSASNRDRDKANADKVVIDNDNWDTSSYDDQNNEEDGVSHRTKSKKVQLKKETRTELGSDVHVCQGQHSSAEQRSADPGLLAEAGTGKKQGQSESDFWELYKSWAEKRCLTKFQVFERHVNQLFIRGDNVVSVSVAQ